MALNRYVLTATVAVTAGTPATPVAGEPATGGAAGLAAPARRQARCGRRPTSKGQVIMLDPASALYSAIGAGNLRAWSDSEAVGHAGLAN